MAINFENKIIGEHIILRKVELEDAKDIYTWRSGKSGKYLRHPEGYSIVMQEEWINSRSNKEINYIIHDKKTGESVGMISIYNIEEYDKVAEVGRLLLSDYYLSRSNPYGLEALLLTYDYVFTKMNFRKITGVIGALNTAMVKLQIFLGMKQEGYLERHTLIGSIFDDLYIFSIFKDQFNSIYKKKILFLLKNFKINNNG